MARAAARSHLSDGRCVGWFAPPGDATNVAVDAELEVAPPPALAARFGADRFWERWTRAECAAKLSDVPIVVWLRRHGLGCPPDQGIDLVTVRLRGAPSVVVTVGIRRTPPRSGQPGLDTTRTSHRVNGHT
ncbi:MAG: hypothetical protein HOQ22_01910 [Nocardioidaceae bacterium]|nr:hypothetical protein [Nocardioidaceae bacterium]NUS49780.1 hypothetical protein [Nocardioidaceae bacterium]